ncbi:MAG: murein transglycosylase, partial [Gammaproteobacteria bacterium]|nr:murein transglycosylase [Gammaproteobacteria bacterium]
MSLVESHFQDIPGWQGDHQEDAFRAFQNSCQKLLTLSSSKKFWPSCIAASHFKNQPSTEEARQFFEAYFKPYAVVGDTGRTGLFTGYFEPAYPASLVKTSTFNVPLYGRPANLVELPGEHFRLKINHQFAMMPTRAQIAHGPLLPDTPVLAWARSRVDRFFLQVQGSGLVMLPDGSQMLLGYDGQNGWAYQPIGAYLLQIGAIDKQNISMQTIRAWLDAHPDRVDEVLNYTPSFVFFRRMAGTAPIGAEGVPLTPKRSLAVDKSYISLGTPIFLDTYLPKLANQQVIPGSPLRALLVAQDVGGAIKSPVRGDVFWVLIHHVALKVVDDG